MCSNGHAVHAGEHAVAGHVRAGGVGREGGLGLADVSGLGCGHRRTAHVHARPRHRVPLVLHRGGRAPRLRLLLLRLPLVGHGLLLLLGGLGLRLRLAHLLGGLLLRLLRLLRALRGRARVGRARAAVERRPLRAREPGGEGKEEMRLDHGLLKLRCTGLESTDAKGKLSHFVPAFQPFMSQKSTHLE